MASLKEIKGRIASVQSTLKITSAMKMVASAKLHKAQSATEGMLPYQRQLQQMLSHLLAAVPAGTDFSLLKQASAGEEVRVALVAIASNTSLCGGFNANVIREAKARIAAIEEAGETVEVFSVGRKVSDAMRKSGYPSAADWDSLIAHASYDGAASLASALVDGFTSGQYSRVELVYNHFVSVASQKVVCETYLPMSVETGSSASVGALEDDIIIEPNAVELLESLLPRVFRLKIYSVLLDSSAAEHAARTIAMQMATDNGEEILSELTLEYNKGRQQKITSEILDIIGGTMR